jgi:hypothetical protein
MRRLEKTVITVAVLLAAVLPVGCTSVFSRRLNETSESTTLQPIVCVGPEASPWSPASVDRPVHQHWQDESVYCFLEII